MNIVLPNRNNSSIPLVFVTTSNMNDEKLDKLFDFSILTPIVVIFEIFREEMTRNT